MTDKTMHINFNPQDMQLVRSIFNNKSYRNEQDNTQKFNSISIDMDEIKNYNFICEEITNLILEIIRSRTLKEYIYKSYTTIEKEEKESVYIEAKKILNKKEEFIKETIYDKVSNFIIENDELGIELDVDGFYKFRMKDFISYIAIISDIALEEHLIKRDKKEFFDSLKYFIDVQDEKMDLLRIIITKDESFILSDENGDQLEEMNNQEMINIAMQENLNEEDMLISAVMTLCPRRIEVQDNLKNDKSKETIDVLKLLFEGKVTEVYIN